MSIHIDKAEYKLEDNRLMIKKGLMITPDEIFKKHNINAKVLESFPASMGMLDGEKVAVRMYAIEATEMSAMEIELAEEAAEAAEDAQLAAEAAKNQAEADAAANAVDDAPPPL